MGTSCGWPIVMWVVRTIDAAGNANLDFLQ